MRGAPKSKLTEAQRHARQLAASRRWQEERAVRFLAQGLRTDGQPRKYQKPLSPRMQKLLAKYQRKLKRNQRPVQLTPLEAAWRSERAAMGEIIVPEIKLYSMGRGETES